MKHIVKDQRFCITGYSNITHILQLAKVVFQLMKSGLQWYSSFLISAHSVFRSTYDTG